MSKHKIYASDESQDQNEISLNEMIDLLKRMLHKEPNQRITLEEIAEHKWITCNGTEPCDWANDVDFVEFEDPKNEELDQEVS